MEEINTSSPEQTEITAQNDDFRISEPIASPTNKDSELEVEINTLYNSVGMRDISHYGFIELRGNDVLDFLDRISTNSVKNIIKGETTKTIFCTEKGRIIDSAVIVNLDEYQIIITSQEHHEKMMIWLQKYVISDDVKLTNINGKYTLLEVLGPQADSFMTLINGNIVNSIPPNTIKIMNNEGIIFFLMKHFDANGRLIYWILADPNYAQKLIRFMLENKGPFDFNLIGEEAFNYYRIESGIPVSPNEINDLTNPQELGLMNLVNSSKGCYIGQEVIARLETYGKVQKQLCGFIFNQNFLENEQLTVFDQSNNEAGNVTSSVFSKKLNKYIGLGFVKRKYFEDGTTLFANNGSNVSLEVIVKKLPFKK